MTIHAKSSTNDKGLLEGQDHTYSINEDFQNATEIFDHCLWCEEETIGQNLQSHFNTHTEHKDVFCYLEKWRNYFDFQTDKVLEDNIQMYI